MGKLVPVILMLGGLVGGLGAGFGLKKPAAEECQMAASGPEGEGADQTHAGGDATEHQGGENAVAPALISQDCGDEAALKTGEQSAQSGYTNAKVDPTALNDFAKLPTQFVIPILEQGRMRALVALSVSLEVSPGFQERVFSLEPKLRDAFLRVLFRHANSGGFEGNYIDRRAMDDLRGSLFQAAKLHLGDSLIAVLILDIVRQDVG